MQPISYSRHRFPPVVIRHAVWLYLRFTLSYCDVEDLQAERGLEVSNPHSIAIEVPFGRNSLFFFPVGRESGLMRRSLCAAFQSTFRLALIGGKHSRKCS